MEPGIEDLGSAEFHGADQVRAAQVGLMFPLMTRNAEQLNLLAECAQHMDHNRITDMRRDRWRHRSDAP